MLRLFRRIVVDELQGHWSASFTDEVHLAFGGEHPAQAIRRLLDAAGSDLFDDTEILADDEQTRDGHLEFLIPLRGRVRIPVPSRN